MGQLAKLLGQQRYYLVYAPEILSDPSVDDTSNVGLYVVRASSEHEAFERYIDMIIEQDEMWLGHVYTNTVNMSIGEYLWVDDDGRHLLDSQGELRMEYDAAYAQFKRNVEDWFAGHPEYAKLYLRFWDENEEQNPLLAHLKWRFPHEMMKLMFHANAQVSGELFQEIKVVRLDEIQELT